MLRERRADPKPESRYEVLALFAGAMIASSLFVVSTGTLTPFIETTLALPQSQLGLILSIQFIGSMLATAASGALTDRFGDKAVVFWSGWVMGIALLSAAAVRDVHWLLSWLAIYGIGYASVTPAGSHAIVYFFRKEDRGFAMGVRQCGVPVAGVIGSATLPIVALRFDYQWALVAAGIVTIAACSIASLLYREPLELQGERVSVRVMLAEMLTVSRDARLILMTLTSMVLVCAQMVLLAFLALTVVHEAQLSIAVAVGIFTLSQVFAIAGRVSWGWVSDRIFRGSRALPLAVVCVFTALLAYVTSLVTPHTALWAIAVLAAALGFCAEGWFGVGAIAFAEIGGEEHAGSALGVALTWVFFAAFVAPTLFGALADSRGYPFAWRSVALLSIVGVVPALLAAAAMRHAAPSKTS
jgi:MFS family permease